MKLLITGIHGFVGSNLVSRLSNNHSIYGVDIVTPRKEGVLYTYSWDDLESEGLIPDVDAIIHLAGKAHDTKNRTASDAYFEINTGLTKRIYDYFLQSRAQKFIFFSSAKAVADKVDGVLTENVVPAPVGPYGESKIKAEEYIMRNFVTNKMIYILRPCMIHGPGNKGNLNLLYNFVSKGFPWPLSAFDNRRTFTSIDNLTYIVSSLLTMSIPSGIYNVGDDEAISTNELIEAICASVGKKAHFWRLPKRLLYGIAKIGGLLHLPLNQERFQKLTENYILSNTKIKTALGIDQMPVRAMEGIEKTLLSFVKDRE